MTLINPMRGNSGFKAANRQKRFYSVRDCLMFVPQQDEHENMEDMSIFDMNVVDEADNDNGIPVEEDEDKAQDFSEELCDEDELLRDSEEQHRENMGLEDELQMDEVSPTVSELMSGHFSTCLMWKIACHLFQAQSPSNFSHQD